MFGGVIKVPIHSNSRVVTANDDWRRPAPEPWTMGQVLVEK